MVCAFCQRALGGEETAFALCPECEARLVGVSALSLEYAWFVAAVRRALFGA